MGPIFRVLETRTSGVRPYGTRGRVGTASVGLAMDDGLGVLADTFRTLIETDATTEHIGRDL